MHENDFFEELKKHALDSDNYRRWRKEHTKAFGNLFEDAFSRNTEAQLCLTAALINISQRNFELAMPKLDMLGEICDNEFDETAVYYFKGLNHEMLRNEAAMAECYEHIKSGSVVLSFVLAFHPYYRIAKLAQRDSECRKSIYYYRKALEFYDGIKPDPHAASIAGHIIYDIATVYLYMHEYQECERFLEASCQYDKSQNHHRDYVKAILRAVQGRRDDCFALLKALPSSLRENCQTMTEAILCRRDLHYCFVPQDRTLYADFWSAFLKDEASIRDMVMNDRIAEAERNVSQRLTKALGFMNRPLDCRIEKKIGHIVIKCKNYRAKSLIEEYAALFALKPEGLSIWKLVSVEEFSAF